MARRHRRRWACTNWTTSYPGTQYKSCYCGMFEEAHAQVTRTPEGHTATLYLKAEKRTLQATGLSSATEARRLLAEKLRITRDLRCPTGRR